MVEHFDRSSPHSFRNDTLCEDYFRFVSNLRKQIHYHHQLSIMLDTVARRIGKGFFMEYEANDQT